MAASFDSNNRLAEPEFRRLFESHYNSLCRFAFGYLNNPDDAEEIVQEVFVNLWQKQDGLQRNEAMLKGWLYTSVKNRCLNWIRDHAKFASNYLDIELEKSGSVEQYFEAEVDDLTARIENAISKLPDRCREIFVLSRDRGMKYRQIAETLNISVKTVEVQMSKALRILRAALKDLTFWLIMFVINRWL
ncbi:MAG: RNA polymerase sigma-70 factor [Bacteroidales bacterium]